MNTLTKLGITSFLVMGMVGCSQADSQPEQKEEQKVAQADSQSESKETKEEKDENISTTSTKEESSNNTADKNESTKQDQSTTDNTTSVDPAASKALMSKLAGEFTYYTEMDGDVPITFSTEGDTLVTQEDNPGDATGLRWSDKYKLVKVDGDSAIFKFQKFTITRLEGVPQAATDSDIQQKEKDVNAETHPYLYVNVVNDDTVTTGVSDSLSEEPEQFSWTKYTRLGPDAYETEPESIQTEEQESQEEESTGNTTSTANVLGGWTQVGAEEPESISITREGNTIREAIAPDPYVSMRIIQTFNIVEEKNNQLELEITGYEEIGGATDPENANYEPALQSVKSLGHQTLKLVDNNTLETSFANDSSAGSTYTRTN